MHISIQFFFTASNNTFEEKVGCTVRNASGCLWDFGESIRSVTKYFKP